MTKGEEFFPDKKASMMIEQISRGKNIPSKQNNKNCIKLEIILLRVLF